MTWWWGVGRELFVGGGGGGFVVVGAFENGGRRSYEGGGREVGRVGGGFDFESEFDGGVGTPIFTSFHSFFLSSSIAGTAS